MQTTIFKSNRSQAVRLPKAVAFPDDVKYVEVIAVGYTRVITPANKAWDDWFDEEGVGLDYMADCEQPEDQQRKAF